MDEYGIDRDELHRLAQKAWRDNLKAAPKTKEYKLLNQIQYKSPPGYTPYKEIIKRLGANIIAMYMGGKEILNPSAYTESIAYPIMYYQAVTKGPTYWLDAHLINTTANYPGLPTTSPFVNGLVLIPNNILITPDGESVDHFLFMYIKDVKGLPPIKYPDGWVLEPMSSTTKPHLIISTTLPSSVVYALNTELNRERDIEDYPYKPNPFTATTGEPNEIKFLGALNHLAINSLNIILNQPERVSNPPMPERIGFAAAPTYRSIYEPRWIR